MSHPPASLSLSERSMNIPPFYVMEVLESAQKLEQAGRDIIHLEIGEPDFPTAPHICEAANQSLASCNTRYTHSLGLPELRSAIVDDYNNRFGLDLVPEQVLVTSGTSPALMLTFMALLDQGDGVLMSNPHYACYPNFVSALGCQSNFAYTSEENGFGLTPELVSENLDADTSAILINSPSNPTGYVMSSGEMQGIAEIAENKGNIPIISDEIYQGLIYGGKDHSILEYTDNAFVLNGFSKKYCMTGWRLGYMIAPLDCMRVLQKLQQNFFICANSFVQEAGIAALRGPQDHVGEMVATYDERRKHMLKRLKDIGFRVGYEPMGAFYVLADASEFGTDSLEMSRTILNEAGVAVTPGIDFGDGAQGYIRFSYANSLENIEEGMKRLDTFLNG
ncbi:aspartate aminotransferase [Methanococcoides methylutens]|uniref:Aspartate aminotransferase n=1 Tax=Methanococcoides methylutens TaxID=2226 RepID=A0A099T0U8_METMT|nr:pyridoxal phosphate-dependent aminotransferase [Methanococcoides methylutens]KGK97723.1 aspartate aminotransferase [Methanococcoides methylutens]